MIIRRKKDFAILNILFSISLLFLPGCFFGDKVIRPVKVSDAPNTFKFSEEKWGGKVIYVEVYDSTYTETLWHIEAIQEAAVKGFIVNVGNVPKGFKQTIPDKKTNFTLNSGEEYIILIIANYKPPAWSVETSWVAD